MGTDPDAQYAEYVGARLARLHKTAYLMCGDPHRAADLVQATLVSLYLHWRRASAADNLDGYVHRIMARRFVDEQRRPWSRVLLRPWLPEPPPEPDDDRLSDRDRLVTALRAVPPRQRAVLVLRFFADLSVQETAAALGCATGTVKSQCARGLATMRELLTPQPAHAHGTEDDRAIH
jgi:RNA polymerase sigma-70 factor (sigma-E family)